MEAMRSRVERQSRSGVSRTAHGLLCAVAASNGCKISSAAWKALFRMFGMSFARVLWSNNAIDGATSLKQ